MPDQINPTPPNPPSTPLKSSNPTSNIEDLKSNPHDHHTFIYIVMALMGIVIAGLLLFIFFGAKLLKPSPTLTSFDECVEETGKILDSYPAQCLFQGQAFTQASPTPNQITDEGGILVPPPDPTADWQTYTNTKHGYSFKYPSGWEINDASGKLSASDNELAQESLVTLFNSNSTQNSSGNSITFIANHGYPKQESSIIDILPIQCESIIDESCISQLHRGVTQPYTISTISGSQALKFDKYENDPSLNTYFTEIFLLNQNQVFLILIQEDSTTLDENLESTHNQILSTFEFSDINSIFDETKQSSYSLPKRLSHQLVTNLPNIPLPPGIEINQLDQHAARKINDTYYVNFKKQNMNHHVNSDVLRSGVITANEGDLEWRVLFEINDLAQNSNNPYQFWIENDRYFVVIVDSNGAGSGEGNGKLISINRNDNTWQIIDCFYFVPETFHDHLASLPAHTPLSHGVVQYQDANSIKNNSDYTFDKSLRKFTSNGRINEACTSFDIILDQ